MVMWCILIVSRASFTTLLTFSEPLSNSSGHPKRGNISLINWAIVSAVLTGTAKASGQPLNQSTKVTTYILPDNVFGYGPDKSRLNFAKGYNGISVSEAEA